MKPTTWVLAVALGLALALARPGHAGRSDANDCMRESTDGAGGRIFTNICRSLVPVGSCHNDGQLDGGWSCDYTMYSPGETFRGARRANSGSWPAAARTACACRPSKACAAARAPTRRGS